MSPERPKESDWKAYSTRIEEWRERFLERKTGEIAAILASTEDTPSERFWNAAEEVDQVKEILEACLGRFSRSSMKYNLVIMSQCGFITDDDLEVFSPDLRETIRSVKDV